MPSLQEDLLAWCAGLELNSPIAVHQWSRLRCVTCRTVSLRPSTSVATDVLNNSSTSPCQTQSCPKKAQLQCSQRPLHPTCASHIMRQCKQLATRLKLSPLNCPSSPALCVCRAGQSSPPSQLHPRCPEDRVSTLLFSTLIGSRATCADTLLFEASSWWPRKFFALKIAKRSSTHSYLVSPSD